MLQVQIIGDSNGRNGRVADLLKGFCQVTTILLGNAVAECVRCDAMVIAVDLKDSYKINALKNLWALMAFAPKRLFLLEEPTRLSISQSYALGATAIIKMPADRSAILAKLFSPKSTPFSAAALSRGPVEEMATEFNHYIFGRLGQGHGIDVQKASKIANAVKEYVATDGLSAWLSVVREHHEGTFQHCLLVMGVTADFGLKLGLNEHDLGRSVLGAVLHDVGKSIIPVSILEKPGRLDDEERSVVETHPVVAFEALKDNPTVPVDVLDAVHHHHEFLDGSGYPDKLSGASISDMTRILTISDVFSALIEHRSYRSAMPREEAFAILKSMDQKLEMPLVEAFGEVALGR